MPENWRSYRSVRAFLDNPDAAPQPPPIVLELAAGIERSLSRNYRPDVRAWALFRVLLGALDEVIEGGSLDAEHEELAASGLISIARAIMLPPHLAAREQIDDMLGE